MNRASTDVKLSQNKPEQYQLDCPRSRSHTVTDSGSYNLKVLIFIVVPATSTLGQQLYKLHFYKNHFVKFYVDGIPFDFTPMVPSVLCLWPFLCSSSGLSVISFFISVCMKLDLVKFYIYRCLPFISMSSTYHLLSILIYWYQY